MGALHKARMGVRFRIQEIVRRHGPDATFEEAEVLKFAGVLGEGFAEECAVLVDAHGDDAALAAREFRDHVRSGWKDETGKERGFHDPLLLALGWLQGRTTTHIPDESLRETAIAAFWEHLPVEVGYLIEERNAATPKP